MLKKKKTLIISQRFERVIVRRRSLNSDRILCNFCGEAGEMLSIEESVLIFKINLRSIFSLLEKGQVHFAELPSGLLLVCIQSLQEAIQKTEQ